MFLKVLAVYQHTVAQRSHFPLQSHNQVTREFFKRPLIPFPKLPELPCQHKLAPPTGAYPLWRGCVWGGFLMSFLEPSVQKVPWHTERPYAYGFFPPTWTSRQRLHAHLSPRLPIFDCCPKTPQVVSPKKKIIILPGTLGPIHHL